MREDIKRFLSEVEKPGRYTGGEPGSVIKDKSALECRVAFCFPDIYEIGMSNLGMRILTGVLNEMNGVWCERVFAPWPDMEERLRSRSLPLFTLDSGDFVRGFDFVAFTLQYELCYTTAVNMLVLSGIEPLAKKRSEDSPVILAGGPCAYNPEPMADFVDIFSIGEGEEALPELVALYMQMKKSGEYTKSAFLRRAASLEGFYVPSMYSVTYNDDLTIRSFEPEYDDIPRVIKKRAVADFDRAYVPVNPVLPLIETVHDRVSLEVFRGCIRGCRFCQAGFIGRPVREKSPEVLCDIAKKTVGNTGYDEISLNCLSISDYSRVNELTNALVEWTDEMKINLSLPSMRADSFTKELLDRVSSVRSSTLTFAPEAGTPRLRDVINKNVTEEDILKAAHLAFAAGKSQVKLYFMLGLPFESDEDLDGIASLASRVVDEYYKTPERNRQRQVQVTISVACFIPKPHTPFQWEGQCSFDRLCEKQQYLASKITDRKVRYNYHDASVSRLEAVFARGDRRLSAAILEAAKNGMRLDAWEEFFDYAKWMAVFERCGIDPERYANRVFDENEILPWDMIDCGVDKAYMKKEREKASRAAATPSCREKCSACGADKFLDRRFCTWCPGSDLYNKQRTANAENVPDRRSKTEKEPAENKSAAPESHTEYKKVRVRFAKKGALVYTSHLDLVRVMMRSLMRSGLELKYTEGFNPKPKLSFASPLSLGITGERELMEIQLPDTADDREVVASLKSVMPDGLEIIEAFTAENKVAKIKWAEYVIELHSFSANDENARRVCALFTKPVILMKRSKSGEKETDITPLINRISAHVRGGSIIIAAVCGADSEHYLNPEYIIKAVQKYTDIYSANDYHEISRRRILMEDMSEFR